MLTLLLTNKQQSHQESFRVTVKLDDWFGRKDVVIPAYDVRRFQAMTSGSPRAEILYSIGAHDYVRIEDGDRAHSSAGYVVRLKRA